MSEADDLLREASDPTTPPGRLQVLFSGSPGLSDEQSRRLRAAVVGNPSLPSGLLFTALGLPRDDWCLPAWLNPAVTLLLLCHPAPMYEEMALRALQCLSIPAGSDWEVVPVSTLAEGVAAWAAAPADDASEERAFARHLAGLFGLPWPPEP